MATNLTKLSILYAMFGFLINIEAIPLEITTAINFYELIGGNGRPGEALGQLVVVELHSEECQSFQCKTIADTLDALDEKYNGSLAIFVKVDVNEAPEVAALFNYKQLPHIIFIRKGQILEQITMSADQALKPYFFKWLRAPIPSIIND